MPAHRRTQTQRPLHRALSLTTTPKCTNKLINAALSETKLVQPLSRRRSPFRLLYFLRLLLRCQAQIGNTGPCFLARWLGRAVSLPCAARATSSASPAPFRASAHTRCTGQQRQSSAPAALSCTPDTCTCRPRSAHPQTRVSQERRLLPRTLQVCFWRPRCRTDVQVPLPARAE